MRVVHSISNVQGNANWNQNKVSSSTNETVKIKTVNNFNCYKKVEPQSCSYTTGKSGN